MIKKLSENLSVFIYLFTTLSAGAVEYWISAEGQYSSPNESPKDDNKLHLMMRFQFVKFWECRVHHHWHYSQVNLDWISSAFYSSIYVSNRTFHSFTYDYYCYLFKTIQLCTNYLYYLRILDK